MWAAELGCGAACAAPTCQVVAAKYGLIELFLGQVHKRHVKACQPGCICLVSNKHQAHVGQVQATTRGPPVCAAYISATGLTFQAGRGDNASAHNTLLLCWGTGCHGPSLARCPLRMVASPTFHCAFGRRPAQNRPLGASAQTFPLQMAQVLVHQCASARERGLLPFCLPRSAASSLLSAAHGAAVRSRYSRE